MKNRRTIKMVLLASCAVMAPAMAQAQEGATGAAAQEDVIGEIIVTAQRRSESVLKVPASVSVVTADVLTANGVSDLSTLTKLTPSLQTGSDDSFSIRGIGTNTFSPTVESTVSQVVDDVVLGIPAFAAGALYDVQRVEVLNGPQGLLFGKNASAGLVNITTVDPKLGETSGYINAEGTSRSRPGSDGLGIRNQAALNVPISDTSALRIAGTYSYQDALTRNLGKPVGRNDGDVEQKAVRVKFLADPGNGLTVNLGGDYFKNRGVSGFWDTTYRSLGPNTQYRSILASAGVVPGPDNLDMATDGPAWRDLEMGGVQGKLAYAFDNGLEISSISAWKKLDQSYASDSDQTPVNFLNTNTNASQYNQFSEELRVALPNDGPFGGQAGLYYFQSNTDNQVQRGGFNNLPAPALPQFPFCVGATVTAGPPPACSVSNLYFLGQDASLQSKVRSYAGFGQFNYALTEQLKLTAGGRLTYDKASIDLIENTGKYFVTLGVPNNISRGKVDNTNFSWKVGLDYDVVPDTLLYGFYGRGYKGPGFSNSSPARGADISVQPEISKGGEVGVKSALLDRKLVVSAAAFHTRFSNLQVQSFNEPLQTIILTNAATATTKGIDIGLQVRPAHGLTLGASLSYVDAKFNSYPGVQCYATQPDPSCAINATFDASGRRVPLSAKFTSTLTADYTTPLTESLDGSVGVTYYHRSPLNSGFAPEMTIPSTDRFDLNLSIKADSWSAGLFCKNCFNQIRPFNIGNEPGDAVNAKTLTLTQRFNYDSVRTIGVRMGVNF
ncbi:TonB-dependent receptor [Niveispirillum sp. BGYR6]|uniref:TonB-dependent receptor n=1 Tax=Niveispirillum sp. BGYR6 TaxID=2971249 RepID=UPI0022B94183|nr:TonB-dependent receptor [Niveispirillum sp. BGYR6]MDG5497211.1 TonB-dependent receptor [Niveispirillum sp. BGYR6]